MRGPGSRGAAESVDQENPILARQESVQQRLRTLTPENVERLESFCLDLKTFLEGLHATRAHPTDQTLRGGTQTFGALFQNPAPILQRFVTQLRKSIAQYIAEMPDDPSHPLFVRKARDFDFSGSWSVRLSSGGFHTNHDTAGDLTCNRTTTPGTWQPNRAGAVWVR